jgi:WD repeat-containing protein mio
VDHGEYERAAALAIWHGDIGLAVESLQRGADDIRSCLSTVKTSDDNPHTNFEYVQLMELVSLSIAGYHGGNEESGTSQVWHRSTSNILRRPEFQNTNKLTSGAIYLRHILNFLLTIGDNKFHKEFLNDATLSLTDRVAFASRFVSRNNLKTILEKYRIECMQTGNVEGILITGLGREGISILQKYVDLSADIQSAALITSRIVLPPDWNTERRVIAEWVHTYRMLLNTLHMWRSRAIFDVDRAQLLRKVKQRTSDAAIQSTNIQSIGRSGSNLMVSGRRQKPNTRSTRFPDQDVQASVPAQLEARCNYCGFSLSLRKQDTQPNQWLSKMKNVLSCCPNCRKPLPRCSICMLPLGALNPYMELVRNSQSTSKHGSVDDLSQLASVPFAEWFTWCVRCKHGGHANHLVGWFAKHDICPVSGCSCSCQFDATTD